MDSTGTASGTGLRYQADDKLPPALAVGFGVQLAALTISTPIFVSTLVMRTAGTSESIVSWAAFASVVTCGIATALQAARFERIGCGHLLLTASSVAFIWPCVEAIQRGGLALLASLVVVASLFQFFFSAHLAFFRRIMSPGVSGTVLMLTPVTAMPLIFDMLDRVPDHANAIAGPVTGFATLAIVVVLSLRAKGPLRLWLSFAGLAGGSVVGAAFGLYDYGRVAEAPWIGIPQVAWLGLGLDFSPGFWSLLPTFLLVMLVVTLRTTSSNVAIQSVSWRQKRTVDFRSVQGAVNVIGISNTLCGLAGTIPNTSISIGASMVELTGVAARVLGIAAGATFIALAFLPKFLAAFLAIPDPVIGSLLTILMSTVFVIGIKVLLQDGLDYRKGMIAGTAFWIGVGFQYGFIFPRQAAEFADGLFANAMTSGGTAAILMTLIVEVTWSRRQKMECDLDSSVFLQVGQFIESFTNRSNLSKPIKNRLEAVAEETMLSLHGAERGREDSGRSNRLRIVAWRDGDEAVLQFTLGPTGENIQNRLALLKDQVDESIIEEEISLRILRRLSSSVRHQQFHEIEIITVRVKPPTTS